MPLLLFVFIALGVLLSPPKTHAAIYNCGVCTGGGTKFCTIISCDTGCYCVPTVDNLTLANGQPEVCVNGACNGKDIVVDLDVTNHNQKITIKATATDGDAPTGSRLSDIQYMYINFDTNNNPGDGVDYQVKYTDNGDGTQTYTYTGTHAAEITASNATAGFSAPTLTLNVTLDVSGISGTAPFMDNGYLQATDFSTADTGVTRKVGSGAFSQGDDPYSGNAANTVDMWSGKNVKVAGGFYVVSAAADICVADKSALTPVSNFSVDATYSPAGSWDNPITNWTGGSTLQPFTYFGNSNYKINYKATAGGSYYLVSMDNQRYDGTCPHTVSSGTVQDVIYKQGGKRLSATGKNYSESAFGVKQINNTWSQTNDGNFFSSTGIEASIETSGCPTCYFMDKSSSPTNGVPVVNGTINAVIQDHFGSSDNWNAQQGGAPSDNPYVLISKPTYTQLKALFDNVGATYTEYTGNKTLSSLSLTADDKKIFFVNGDFTVDANNSLNTGKYDVVIVSGNFYIESGVTATQGLFIVQGNGQIRDDGVANYDPNVHTDQLTIEGGIVVGGNLLINRTMGAGNNTAAPVIVTVRPDILKALSDDNVALAQKQKLWLGEL